MSTTALLARLTGQLPIGFRTCKQGEFTTSNNSINVQGTVCKTVSVQARKSVTNHLLLLQTQLHNFEDERLGLHAWRSRFAAIESLCCNSLYMCSATVASRGSRIQLPARLWQSVPRRSQRTPEGHRYCNRSVCRVYRYA